MDSCSGIHGQQYIDATINMSKALSATGRSIWFMSKAYQARPWCDSVRITPDHHDFWHCDPASNCFTCSATDTHIDHFFGPGAYGAGPGHWNDNDFLMTGGAGCDVDAPGRRCPGMTDAEYQTEFSAWALGASTMLVSTDLRNMSDIQRRCLYNTEILAINQDKLGAPLSMVVPPDTSGKQVWARYLSGNATAIAFYNPNTTSQAIEVLLAGLPYAVNETLTRDSVVHVRDVWNHSDVGSAHGSISTVVQPRSIVVYVLKLMSERHVGS